ncbi:ABC transporter ATP-binding protein [Winogradskyella sp.]|uniref:ABC transporter ATP-binding protein n=1 Tax=Winogradskyella sp. TaxID=1883156 RepID=UPI001B2B8D43|nr:ABC transporter ATP-binding protein [Winogradskyella sp.]MBO6881597.1 ABC transporter ATP-binding protein [Winogradskyella sp.]
MPNVILKVENISKQYRLGVVGTGTLSHDLKRWFYKLRGKDDPYLKIGDTNDRSKAADSDYVWAIKDINFEVKRGEVLGIIGKNGAGKSTLLKILSRVTSPTTGQIKTKGRIASLLEVGTGFHPELTGKENIYLNGAILGMTKAEIKTKEQEIIDFSGCERYIDTPVKRYSSGMRVRLAFAVAAFLEPDILVVDEVLAVGDAEFQKKAIGKMQDISKGDGRTVLFVSHNMAAVQDLCSRVIVLEHGKVSFNGSVEKGIDFYLSKNDLQASVKEFSNDNPLDDSVFLRFEIQDDKQELISQFKSGDTMIFKTFLKLSREILNPVFTMRISNSRNISVVTWRTDDLVNQVFPKKADNELIVTLMTNQLYLLNDKYSISMSLLDGIEVIETKIDFINFEVHPNKPNNNYNTITKKKSTNSIIYSVADWNIEINDV